MIPYTYVYGVGPVSAVLMMISYTVTLVQKISLWRAEGKEEKK
jgi:hypothetical protein